MRLVVEWPLLVRQVLVQTAQVGWLLSLVGKAQALQLAA
jgi:hypothetical protein